MPRGPGPVVHIYLSTFSVSVLVNSIQFNSNATWLLLGPFELSSIHGAFRRRADRADQARVLRAPRRIQVECRAAP